MKLAKLFKAARKDRKIVSVAKDLDCSPGYLSTIEQGKNTPSPQFCEMAADTLDCPEIACYRWKHELRMLEEALTVAKKQYKIWSEKGLAK